MPEQPVLISDRRGSTLVLHLNRPDAGNAINGELAHALLTRLAACEGDTELRSIVITGTGERFFCTGGDVKAYAMLASVAELDRAFGLMRDVCDKLERLPCAVIAAINGYAIGGGAELALACDLRVAQASAQIGFPQSRLGLIPGWDGAERLLRTVGRSQAAKLMFSGLRVGAQEAHGIGLIDEIAPDGQVLVRALEWAASVAEVAPLSLGAIKDVLRDGGSGPADAAPGRVRARETFARLWFTADHKEAEAAFAQKRAPRFCGR
jgi:enoyl-CoA hydratase/carnithine racemase